MQLDPIKIKSKQNLIEDYKSNNAFIMNYFDYPLANESYSNRVDDLNSRSFKREQLSEVLYQINKDWDAPHATLENINRLREPNSVVVIGGQQAGLLTGPMYTVHKIISILQLAKEQEEQLNIPVVPVFWIAGEDHDFEEINHVYMMADSEMKKVKFPQHVVTKQPVSDIQIDKVKAEQWLGQIFVQMNETTYTKQLYKEVSECLAQSNTFVDFFARFIFQLFHKEGLVLVDSNHRLLRQLESEFFVEMIMKQPEISAGVCASFKELALRHYPVDLQVDKQDGNLFYHLHQERILLMRDDEGNWVGKQNEVKLSTEELINIAKEKPYLLSNNVMTRPLMQELVFPSLAFVGGLGEISYWSVLKRAFHALNMKMPVVVPRLSFTYVNHKIDQLMEKYTISMREALTGRIEVSKMEWLKVQSTPPIALLFENVKQAITNAHHPLRAVARDLRGDLEEIATTNLQRIHREIDFLEKKMNHAIMDKHAHGIREYTFINSALYPYGGYQERIWNPLPLLNEYGKAIIQELVDANCSLYDEHYIVRL